jgi:NAD(P)-dependent dehydrogenase (short-subunit alcohol dehydrogenase family)
VIKGEPTVNVSAQLTQVLSENILKGKKIIITGGTRGLGYSMAKSFLSKGADVLITGRDDNVLKQTADELGCKFQRLNLQEVDSFDSFLKVADKKLGGINCLVNNAGISMHEPSFFDVTIDSFNDQINTNLRGPFFLTQVFIKYLLTKENHNGKVLFMSSETGLMPDERPYGLTKAAINSLVGGLAYRFASSGIRINGIAPGVVATDMTGIHTSDNLYLANKVTHRAFLPDEIAEVSCYFLSDSSDIINGQVIVCNEGNSINARIKY